MTSIQTLTVGQLRQAIDIKEQIEKLEAQLESLTGAASGKRGPERPPGSRKLSAAAKARISAGMKAKWAARKGNAPKKRRKMSAAGRAAIRAAQKARWDKVRAGKK